MNKEKLIPLKKKKTFELHNDLIPLLWYVGSLILFTKFSQMKEKKDCQSSLKCFPIGR